MGAGFWAVQAFAFCSTALLLASSLANLRRRTLLFCQVAINLLLGASYLLLEGYSGAFCSFLCAGMVLCFAFKEKFRTLLVPVLFAAAYAAFAVFTWQGAASLLPAAGNILLVMAFWCDSEVAMKAWIALVAALWVIYNLCVGSYAGAVGQGLSFVFHVIYVVRHGKERKKNRSS